MDKPFGRLIRSEFFTFLIGPEKVPFVMNSEAITKQSSTLHGLVNGNMLEAHSRTVVWPDVDEDTFARFCEFYYLDNYSPPSCGWDGNTVEEALPVGDDSQSENSDLEDHRYMVPERCARFSEQFKPFSNVTADQDFTPVFLGHARLYVIADKYCIEELKELVLSKLYTTLKGFTPFPKRIGDLVMLIQFVYTEDNTRGCSTPIDPLRKLVTRYMTTVLKDVAMDSAFLGLLLEGGEFVSDFCTTLGTKAATDKTGNILVLLHHRPRSMQASRSRGEECARRCMYQEPSRPIVDGQRSKQPIKNPYPLVPSPLFSSSMALTAVAMRPRLVLEATANISTLDLRRSTFNFNLEPTSTSRFIASQVDGLVNRRKRARTGTSQSSRSRQRTRRSNTTTITTTSTTTATETVTAIRMPWPLRGGSKDTAKKHVSPAHSEVELPPRQSEHSIRSRPRSPLPRLSETQTVTGERSLLAHDCNNGSRLDSAWEKDGKDPALPRAATKRNRFSLMRFRHASDPQLSSSYQNSEPPPVPKLFPPPTIITTSPTNHNLEQPVKGLPPSQLHGQLHFSRSSHNLVSDAEIASRSSSPGLTGRPKKDRSANSTPPASSNARHSHICFEEAGRLSTTSLRSGHRAHAHADSQSGLSNARLSESSRSDGSSGDRSMYFGQPSKKEPASASSSIFRFPRLKKSRPSLFPVPIKLPPTDGQAYHRQTQSSKSAELFSDSNLPSPSHSSSGRPASTAGSPRPPLFRKDSATSGRSKSSISPSATDRAKRRARSSTLGSLHQIQDDTDINSTPDVTPPAISAPRKSFSDLFNIHSRLKHSQHDLTMTPRSGTPTASTPGAGPSPMTPTASKPNSFSLARELSSYPPRSPTDTSATYLSRLESSVHRGAIASILSQSAEEFYSVALRKYMRSFSFFGDPMDMAIRKLLMEAELPRETQHIDRMIQSFANRYHECNPGIFESTEQAYFIAFSLLILHTDVFNKNNKRKMQRADYVKNTRGEGVAEEVLECFYDNICYTPFIHVEDEINLSSRLSSPKARSNLMTKMASTDHLMKSSKDPIDPYALILEGRVSSLRPNLKNVMELEDIYSSTPATNTHLPSPPSIAQLNNTFDNPCKLQIVSARSRPDAFMTESTIANPAESQPGLVDIRVVKVGLLWRKDAKKKKALSPWQEWGAVLTGSQLYLFRDVQWVKSLISQYDAKCKQDSRPPAVTFTPPLTAFKPDTIMSTAEAVALLDSSYKRHKHGFLLVRHGGFEEVFLANSDVEMAEWVNLINYAATYRTSGIRMRGSERAKQSNADPQYTQEAHAARRGQIAAHIKESNEKLFVAQRQVDMLLRNARHLQHLTPIHPRTRGQVILAAGRMSAKVKWARLDLERLKCHRGILARDLAEEEGRVGAVGWKKEVGLALGQMMDGAGDIGENSTLSGEKDSERVSISTASAPNGNGPVGSEAASISAESNRHSISSTIASKHTNVSTPNPNSVTTPITDTDSTSNTVTPRPSITDDDDEEQRFLRETGILALDTVSLSSPPNSPGKQEPITPISTNSTNKDAVQPSPPPSSERSKVRRSFQRTLREAHHNVPLHRTSRKGRDRDSSNSAQSSTHSTSVNASASNGNNPGTPSTPAATSDEPGTLPRKSPSFTVHGKKASIITFGSEWQTLSPEQRLKQRKPQSNQQLQTAQGQPDGSTAGVDDGTDSVFASSIVSTIGPESADHTGTQIARSTSIASTSALTSKSTDIGAPTVPSRCSPVISDVSHTTGSGSGNTSEHQVTHDDSKLVVA
ncbi:hypothetical protein A7C99_6805 [Trichophyton rubrum]|uniref:Guanyl-nucleotide exchange factor n=1 Tax=Trichophyton rubrum TaxID=5551 RepID=A0A178EQG4_TRIRU|nr:hypothetical protein A7C99_6805 [Trichophyton rubrum]